jgi:hypothetical protein
MVMGEIENRKKLKIFPDTDNDKTRVDTIKSS